MIRLLYLFLCPQLICNWTIYGYDGWKRICG